MATLQEIQDFLAREFPQSTVEVLAVAPRRARVRQAVDTSHLRPGGTISGPTMMTLSDVAAYVAVLASIGIVPLAVTTSLHINFLHRPLPERAVIAEGELVKLGKRLAVADVRLYSEGGEDVLAQASVTYSIPPGSV